MSRDAEIWVMLTKRTEDPKLAYIEWLLEGEGIDTRRNGRARYSRRSRRTSRPTRVLCTSI